MTDPLWILLTATIRPNTHTNVSLVDSDVRRRQYRSALAWWSSTAQESGWRVAVVETSGADAEELGIQSARHFTLVNAEPPETLTSKGKGAMEWHAVSKALDELPDIHQRSTIYKVTGRLTVANANAAISNLPRRTVRARTRIDGSLCDTRLIGSDVETWRELLLPAADDISMEAGVDLEHAVGANLRRDVILKKAFWQGFPARPEFEGVSGFSHEEYRPWKTWLRGRALRPAEVAIAKAANRLSH